jgi:hypothetical protein
MNESQVSSLNDGDGLISWQGQRVHPALSCSGGQCTDQPITNLQGFLQGNNSIFESQVSELILGAIDEPDSDKRPGSSVSSFTGYGHGKATITCLSDERQTVIKRDRHANPDRHDVLIAVKRILDGGGSSPSTAPLNDTGITWCANDTTNNLPCPVASHRGQDGDHGRDALARAGQLQKGGRRQCRLRLHQARRQRQRPAGQRHKLGLRPRQPHRADLGGEDHQRPAQHEQHLHLVRPEQPGRQSRHGERRHLHRQRLRHHGFVQAVNASRACAGPATGACRRGGSCRGLSITVDSIRRLIPGISEYAEFEISGRLRLVATLRTTRGTCDFAIGYANGLHRSNGFPRSSRARRTVILLLWLANGDE